MAHALKPITALPNYKPSTIIAFVKNDRRSQEEIFTSIKERILGSNDGFMTEEAAIEATRRLIDFVERAVDNSSNQLNEVDPYGPNEIG